MPRPPRLLLSKSYYHIISRGNNRNEIFKEDEDFYYYLDLIKKYKKENPFDLYHFCLMPNHIHFLIRTQNASDFSLFMKRLNLAYFYHYKKKYDWVGHLWQDRYKSQAVGKDAYFIQCGKYIELNPVRANLVEKPEDYEFTSYKLYAFGVPNKFLTRDIFYKGLGGTDGKRKKEYIKLVIDDLILESYPQKTWGGERQKHNELEKIRYHTQIK